MRLSVIVPATDDPPTLDRCLAALRAVDDPPDEVLVQRTGARSSAGDARNAGAARATGDVLAFVDADVLVHRDAIARMRAALAADEGLDALYGSYDDRPAAPGVVSRFRNLLHHDVHQRAAGPTGSFWAGLGCVRAEAFRRAGGFEPGRRWLEDVELGHRITADGGRIELDPALQGTHLKDWTLRAMLHTDVWRRGRPWVELLLAGRLSALAVSGGWRYRLSALAVLALLVALVVRRPAPAVAAGAALLVLNAGFYRLLLRRGGLGLLGAGVPLHLLHLLAALISLPVGAATFLLAGRRPRPAPAPLPEVSRGEP
jgi:glycosyltransferase involved in cell wall biosynthesis